MNYVFLCSLLIIYSCTHDHFKQERALKDIDVPTEVHEAFNKRHQHIDDNFHLQVMEGDVSYEVHFTENGKDLSERFNAKGKLLETEERIKFEDIPEAVIHKIKIHLDEEHETAILDVQKVRSKDLDGFELKIKSKKSKTGLMEYFFNADGTLHHHEEVELVAIPSLS